MEIVSREEYRNNGKSKHNNNTINFKELVCIKEYNNCCINYNALAKYA